MRHAFDAGYTACARQAVSTIRSMMFASLLVGVGVGLVLAEIW